MRPTLPLLLRRLRALVGLETAFQVTRPLYYIWVALMCLIAYMNTEGGLSLLASGDSATGGKQAVVTSEFAFAAMLAFLLLVLCPFFYGIPAGLSVIRDDEERVAEILNATALRPGQYVWGKFAGVLLAGLSALGLCALAAIFFNHVLPNDAAEEFRGDFLLANYVRPVLFLGVPLLVSLGGLAFAVGAITRQSILTFLLPIAFIIASSVLSAWGSGQSLSPDEREMLVSLEPSGFAWLTQTYTKVDRGSDYYNTQAVGYTATFLLGRAALMALGLGAVFAAHRYRLDTVRKPSPQRRAAPATAQQPTWALTPYPPAPDISAFPPVTPAAVRPQASSAPLAALQMRSRPPGLWSGALAIARAEVAELLRKPGLYLALLLLLLYAIANQSDKTGMFGTKLLLTPGILAMTEHGAVVVAVTLLTLFYAVESLERDRTSGFTAIEYALPIRSGSILIGKWLALSIVGASVTLTLLLVCLAAAARQEPPVPLSLTPFALLWGLLLIPAFAMWTMYLFAVYAVTGHNRYATYGLGLATLFYFVTEPGLLTYFSNPFLMGAVHWSDLSVLEADRKILAVSRVFVLGLALLYAAVAARQFRRRDRDVARTVGRLRPATQMRLALALVPFLVVPVVFGYWTRRLISTGAQGAAAEEQAKDYWRKNVATYQDAPVPGIQNVDMALDLWPEKRAYSGKGTMTLVNHRDEPISRIPMTPGFHWENVRWTVSGEEATPEERSGLDVLYLDSPLEPGETVDIGFSYDAPDPGATRNGGVGMEFLLPSAVVLTSFTESFVPYVGFLEGVGVDEDNRSDPPDREADYHTRRLGALFGSRTPMGVRLNVTGPRDWTLNGVGVRVSDTVKGDRRTVIWEARRDPRAAPVRAFNVVGGPNLTVKKGKHGTAVYYHPAHGHNAAEMAGALDDARRHYSRWFGPYPWPELKLTEFPAMAGYAQGFPTNITFSESMGFLNAENPRGGTAYIVTAHEAAHQWWGNLLMPGDGPGGNVLSEGLAHFATMLLLDTVKGDAARRSFLRYNEKEYLENRSEDSEIALSRLTGRKEGDTTVTYERGGWVFAMLSENVMGRQNMLAGLREFVRKYGGATDDYPLLPDLMATLRPHAPDKAVFDAFVEEWVDGTALPSFRVADARRASRKVKAAGRKGKEKTLTTVTFRVTNVGTGGKMPVSVALKDESGVILASARVTVPAGEKGVACTLRSEQEPAWIEVDPGVRVLQAGRDRANHRFPE